MQLASRLGLIAALTSVLACGGGRASSSSSVSAPAPARPARLAASALPSLERWRHHVTDEVLPYWAMADALGEPIGNFPTFRCNDGTRFRVDAPCRELAQPPGWVKPELGRDYTRMKSRQTFLYGVAFHLTGDERYLEYARAGVAWIRSHAYERDTGSAVSYWENGKPGPPPEQRTTQDLAYAQVGLAFYYYLTRDPEVLGDLVRLEQYIMTRYWQPSSAPPGGMLRWQLADGAPPGDSPTGFPPPKVISILASLRTENDPTSSGSQRVELVAQLDQINAYMLLLAPLIEDAKLAAAWQRDLVLLSRVVKERFFAAERGMFWGTLDNPAEHNLDGRHNDFGHSMKSLWMLYLVGQRTGDRELTDFARPLVAPLLARATQPSGCWASGLHSDGSLARGSQWWIFAELDQAAATLAGREASATPYASYLAGSYACWFERFVDHRDHDVWPDVPDDWTPDTFANGGSLKQFHWKNGYHVMEHAMVAMITTAGLTGQRLPLYYAFVKSPPANRIQPYYFTGTITGDHEHPLPQHPALHGRRIEFSDLR